MYNIKIINLIEPYLKNNNYEKNNQIVEIKPYDFQQDELNKMSSLFFLYDILWRNNKIKPNE
jgi:hypothetical protein